jgi:hypothetical protein
MTHSHVAKFCAVTLALLSLCRSATADAPSPPTVNAARLSARPKIDGVMDDAEWRGARRVELGNQIQPGDNAPPSEKTEVFLAYDREHLYLAFHAYDSDPAAIRARVARRDDVYLDDYVAVYLDTFNDRRRAYVLYFNPLGIQADGIIIGGNVGEASEVKDLTWDGILESKGRVTDDGYVVEAAIPFKTLRFQAGNKQRWGLHLQRWIARKAERVHWQPISRAMQELLPQMGRLEGLENIFAGRTLDLIPTLTGSVNSERERNALAPGGARLGTVNKLDPGLTMAYTLTPNLTLSATINPDFSQIEADVPQLTVNQRFALFYPERRTFFLEGGEFFRSPGLRTFVNTRQIIDPDWGVKLTGKVGKQQIGYMAASDRAPGLRFAPGDARFGENALFNIFRVRRDVGENSRVGLFVTDRRFAGSSNTVLATDGEIRFTSADTLGFQGAWSTTRELNGAVRKGSTSYVWHQHGGRHWRTFTNAYHTTPDYITQTGFNRRSGIYGARGNYGYLFQPEKNSWWVSFRPFVVPQLIRTWDGRIDESYVDPGFDLRLARGVSFYVYHTWSQEYFAGRKLAHQSDIVNYTVNSFRLVSFEGRLRVGEGVSFDARRPQVGRRVEMEHTITFKPNDRLNASLLYLSDRINEKGTSRRLLRQDIIRSRTTYQFTRAHAVRTLLDYDTAARQFGASLLYAWEPRPNTALFMGYNDLLFNGYDPLLNRRDGAAGLVRQRRTLFLKLSYQIRR